MFETLTTEESSLTAPALLPARPRILVVDDARYIRNLLNLHLSNAGYEVDTAEDAVVACRRVLAQPPDIIITDVEMPYMDGIQFVAALRSDPAIPDIPVVFVTARQDIDAEARKLRAAACLTKPLSIDRLLQVVSLYLPAKKQASGRAELARHPS